LGELQDVASIGRYERDRLEAACERALAINAISYSSVSAILKSGLDRASASLPNPSEPRRRTPPTSAAARGKRDADQAKENLIITGQTGTGKPWLACAFARQAARLDHSVLYLRVPRLFENLGMARLDGRFPRLVDKLARVQLLVLDDWGTHSLNDQQRLDLLEIFEERYTEIDVR
jgi:DNA-binding NtrC family response regulator